MTNLFDKQRRSIRPQEFDYAQSSAYFITICAHKRKQIFGIVEYEDTALSALGKIVEYCWMQIPIHNKNVCLDEYVIMPNHLHGIIRIDIGRRGTIYRAPTQIERFGSPVKGSVPTIIRTFKAAVTRRWRQNIGNSSSTVWQRNYYERVIRDELELNKFREYIIENPLRWELDRYYSPN
jgi:REP element-mobilizing transposase RayT